MKTWRLPGHGHDHPELLERYTACPNCKTDVSGKNFCPECGQENVSYHTGLRRLVAFWWDRNVSLDGKLLRSLWALVTRPGLLTVEYNEGRRARFTPPGQLYFLTGVVYFFVFALQVKTDFSGGDFERGVTDGIRAGDTTQVSLGGGRPIASTRMDQDASVPDSVWRLSRDTLVARTQRLGGLHRLSEPERSSLAAKEVAHAMQRVFKDQMEVLTLLSVPLFALALYLFYRSKRPYFIDHLTCAMHLYALSFLLGVVSFAALSSASEAVNLAGSLALIGVLAVYFGASIHRVYRPTWWATIWHCLVLVFYSIFLFGLMIVAAWLLNLGAAWALLRYVPQWYPW